MLEKIRNDMKEAMKTGDKLKVSTLRLAIAEIVNAEKEKREKLKDDQVLEIIAREVKKRVQTIEEYGPKVKPEFRKGLEQEIKVLSQYLPEQMGEEEIRKIVEFTIEKTGARGPKEIGAVMKEIMPMVKGRADGKLVNAIVRELLTK